MANILILGANGQLARHTIPLFLEHADVQLTLYFRKVKRLKNPDPSRARVIEGDVTNPEGLIAAMQGQDVIYANLAGDMPAQAQAIVDAMRTSRVKRLIFISSMGIYGEVPGQSYRSILDPYRDSAAVIEASELDYTVLRPGWFTHDAKGNCRITQKGQPFIGHEVSLENLSKLIVSIARSPALFNRQSIGVSD